MDVVQRFILFTGFKETILSNKLNDQVKTVSLYIFVLYIIFEIEKSKCVDRHVVDLDIVYWLDLVKTRWRALFLSNHDFTNLLGFW